ncbi:MAG: deoxyribonuclease V [Pseudomonadota bacterium]
MNAPITYQQPDTPAQAVAIQQELRQRVRLVNDFATPTLIAGVDVGYDPHTNSSFAVAVLMQMADLTPIAMARAQVPTPFPYVSGLLSFREIPALLAVLEELSMRPDIVMVDGQGIAHPRRLGIAAHLGVVLDMPTIGVAKSRLVGHYEPIAAAPGSCSALMHKGEAIGTVLRSKAGCLPLFISPGHRIDLPTALRVTQQCLKGYRLPEPTRIADKYSKRAQRENAAGDHPLLRILDH